jgi:hypothetical protein
MSDAGWSVGHRLLLRDFVAMEMVMKQTFNSVHAGFFLNSCTEIRDGLIIHGQLHTCTSIQRRKMDVYILTPCSFCKMVNIINNFKFYLMLPYTFQ